MADNVGDESGIDRISALPDDLLCHILSFFPTKLAVRTSVLSTRWRILHKLISSIDIDIDLGAYPEEKKCRFRNFVERDLLCLSRRPIRRFLLKYNYYIAPLLINRWIGELVSRNVQELELCSNYITGAPHDAVIPASLFSSETLVVLKLAIGIVDDVQSLKIPAKVSLPNLKVLHITETTILGDQIENLLSGCPVLDELVLDKFFTYEREAYNLNISNATLKRLTVRFLSTPVVQIVINSPALEYLKFYLHNKESLVLLAKQSLAEVVLEGYSSEPSRSEPNNFAYEYEHDVLQEIKNVQSLQILDYTLQGIYERNFDLPLFNILTYLKLTDSVFLIDARCLEYLLAQCVVLEALVFELHCPTHWKIVKAERIDYLLQQSRLASLLCHLRTIKFQLEKIVEADGEALKKIIEFFLSNSVVLEEVTVRVRDFPDSQQLEMMRELSKIPRVSENCRVVLNQCSI